MKNTLRLAAALIAVAFYTAAPADAALIDLTLGDQDFNDGDIVFPFTFDTNSGGEPVPFDMFRGSDPNTDFSETWTFGYAPIVNPFEIIVSASIEFGILDHDAAHPNSQLTSFGVDGNDLRTPLDAMFEASGGANNEYNIFALALPAAAFTDLRDGTATFSLTLQGPTPGFFDDLPNNGAGLDFARLQIETTVDSPPGVPEPSTGLLLLGGAIGLIASRRRLS